MGMRPVDMRPATAEFAVGVLLMSVAGITRFVLARALTHRPTWSTFTGRSGTD
jgi:hypothetical protein